MLKKSSSTTEASSVGGAIQSAKLGIQNEGIGPSM